MSLEYPYPLAFLSDCLTGPQTSPVLIRFDERSGSADGRFWSARMAQPLWQASYSLYARDDAFARELNAKIYALDGDQKIMLWSDPFYKGPAPIIDGSLASVKVLNIRASDRGALSFSGFAPDQEFKAGDYISITHSGGRIYYGMLAEGGKANANGETALKEIRPYLPFGIAPDQRVEWNKPRMRAMVADFQPFIISRGLVSNEASITIRQKP